MTPARTAWLLGFVVVMLWPDRVVARVECRCPPRAPGNQLAPPLRAGAYRIEFVATRGRKVGRRVTGRIELVRASPTDVSPVTGDQAIDSCAAEFYGWLDADLRRVDAPVHYDEEVGIVPRPDSRDPVWPGVLGCFYAPSGRPDERVLLIGTLSNARTGASFIDGGGIGLRVRHADDDSFCGTWGPWGSVVKARGRFCARRE